MQIYSNIPNDLVVRVDGQRQPVHGVSKANASEPGLFLFVPTVRKSAEMERDLAVWVRDTEKLVRSFHSYPGVAVMVCVPDAILTGDDLGQKLNDLMSLEPPIRQFDVEIVHEDLMWTFIYDAMIRADTSLLMTYEEALATCVSLGHTDRISQVLVDEALVKLDLRRREPTVDELQQRNDLLLLQLERAQEELEELYLKCHEGVDSKQETDDCDEKQLDELSLLPMIAPRSARKVKGYIPTMFDAAFYREQGGVRLMGMLHYRLRGWMMGLDPHPLFDTSYYLGKVNHSLESIDMPPLLHYLKYGSRLDISPHPDFDARFYAAQNPDVVQEQWPVLAHFLACGWREGRMPSRDFDCVWYLNEYKDVAESGINPLVHYVRYGRAEGRLPRPNSQ